MPLIESNHAECKKYCAKHRYMLELYVHKHRINIYIYIYIIIYS